jgi:hypothetical protein
MENQETSNETQQCPKDAGKVPNDATLRCLEQPEQHGVGAEGMNNHIRRSYNDRCQQFMPHE